MCRYLTQLLIDDVLNLECLEGLYPNKKDGTPIVAAKNGGKYIGPNLRNPAKICTSSMKKGKKMKEHDGLEDRRSK